MRLELWLAAALALGAVRAQGQAQFPVRWEAPRLQRSRRCGTAPDGARLCLHRYSPADRHAGVPAVLLVPDLGMGLAAFDLDGRGLAPFLQAKGREVFVLEGRATTSSGYHLSDLVTVELPAALKLVQSVRPGPVDLVVHGYGGSLALAAASLELRGQVRRVVALSAPVLPDVPNPATQALLEEGGSISRLWTEPGGAALFELLFCRGGRFLPGDLSRLRSGGWADLGPSASSELLSWMQQGELVLSDGTTLRSRLASYELPTLMVLALRNNYAHPEYASPLRELAVRAQVTPRVLSRLAGMSEDYSHLSLLHGKAARLDVFEPVRQFLAEGAP